MEKSKFLGAKCALAARSAGGPRFCYATARGFVTGPGRSLIANGRFADSECRAVGPFADREYTGRTGLGLTWAKLGQRCGSGVEPWGGRLGRQGGPGRGAAGVSGSRVVA